MLKRLIIVPQGGLANRMRAIASAQALARRYNVGYRILWPNNKWLGANFEDVFQPLQGLKNISNLHDLFFWDTPRKKNFYLSSLPLKAKGLRVVDDPHHLYAIEGEPVKMEHLIEQGPENIVIRSGLQFYPFEEVDYRRLFVPTGPLRDIIETKAQEFGPNIVGLHIRRTDNRVACQSSPVALFEQYVASHENTRFFLATDDGEVKREFQNKFGPRIITYQSRMSRKTVEGVKDAVIEMFLLARTSRILGSFYSSYSEAAALLGNIPLTQLRSE